MWGKWWFARRGILNVFSKRNAEFYNECNYCDLKGFISPSLSYPLSIFKLRKVCYCSPLYCKLLTLPDWSSCWGVHLTCWDVLEMVDQEELVCSQISPESVSDWSDACVLLLCVFWRCCSGWRIDDNKDKEPLCPGDVVVCVLSNSFRIHRFSHKMGIWVLYLKQLQNIN